MPPHRAVRSVSRRNTPLSPPKPSPTSGSLATRNHNIRGTRSTSRDDEQVASAQHELHNTETVLATVHEEPHFQGTPSDFSGSAGLERDLEELNREDIILSLTNLHAESSALLSMFDLPDTRLRDFIQALSQPGSLPEKKFHYRVKELMRSKNAFGPSTFIDSTLIVRKLSGVIDVAQINYDIWRPDATIYLANLATSLRHLILARSSKDDRTDLLEHLYNHYPTQFKGLHAFDTALVLETLDIAIEIITQFFLDRAEAESVFIFDDLAGEVFSQHSYLLQNFQDETSQAKFFDRLNLLREYSGDTRRPIRVQLNEVRRDFPWNEFTVRLAQWSVARNKELQEIIKKQGGIQSIADLLLSGDFQVASETSLSIELIDDLDELNEETTRNQRPSRSPIHNRTDGSHRRLSQRMTGGLLTANIRRFQEEEEKLATEVSELDPQPSTRPSLQEIPQSPTPVDDGDDLQSVQGEKLIDDYAEQSKVPDHQVEHLQPPSNILDLSGDGEPHLPEPDLVGDRERTRPTTLSELFIHQLRQQSIDSRKENIPPTAKSSLLDRQPDARRLEWNSQTIENDGDRDTQRPPKRPAPQRETSYDEDDMDDEEFEDDPRPTKVSRIAAGKQPAFLRVQQDNWHPDPEADILNNYGVDDHVEPPQRTNRHRTGPITTSLDRSNSLRPTVPSASQPTLTISIPRKGLPSVGVPSRLPPSTAPELGHSRARSPPPSQMELVNAEAKRLIAMSKTNDARPLPQRRVGWSHEEVNRLVEMIDLYNTQWARILEEDLAHENGPRLQGRGQVSLKDKARNIKMDFLKARRELPPGFDMVSIGQRCIDQLKGYGIDYVENRYIAT